MKNKIIIVGGTGFLGFHLAKYYLKNNWQVLSISRKNPKKIRYLKSVNYLFVDIGDKKKLFTILKKHSNTDCIVNFSGEVDHSNSKKVFKSHYLGLKNLAEFFVNKPLKKFVQIGSSLEYGKKTSPQRENFKANPKSNYSKAKFLSTNFLIKLYKTKKLPVIILRPYQVYGPHQDINRLIPIVIQNCLKNKKFPCSNGLQYRDFLYVEDFTKFIIKALETKKKFNGQIFNVGYGKAHKVKNVINTIKKFIKKGFPEFGKIKLRNEENIVTYPNIEKARKLIGWKPKINFNNGIKKTIKYYKNN
jgi:nucleoside-diphosphate-sugar epimerase